MRDSTVAALHRKAWERIKGPLPKGPAGRVVDIPGFAESLRILLVEERYTCSEVGMMFGVSRERVRQWRRALGIAPERGPWTRVWVEADQRFRPIGRRGERREKQPHVAARIADRLVQRREDAAARRVAVLDAGKTLYAELGRAPLWREIASRASGRVVPAEQAGGCMENIWVGAHRKVRGMGAEIRAAFAAIGVPLAPRGQHGHLNDGRADG
jgi:hypothetical protein